MGKETSWGSAVALSHFRPSSALPAAASQAWGTASKTSQLPAGHCGCSPAALRLSSVGLTGLEEKLSRPGASGKWLVLNNPANKLCTELQKEREIAKGQRKREELWQLLMPLKFSLWSDQGTVIKPLQPCYKLSSGSAGKVEDGGSSRANATNQQALLSLNTLEQLLW